MDPSDYAREIERYLCQKNGGHLIRIVGPAFEQVCGWAEQGVPLKVAFRGIDRYCDRVFARGPRRRPVRIEFCEADILDEFDAWRRAVGVARSAVAGPAAGEPAPEPVAARKPALTAHVERVLARLVNVRGRGGRSPAFLDAIDAVVRGLEALLDGARTARGERREAIVARLGEFDDRMMEAARAEIDDTAAERLRREAEDELAPFGSRLTSEARGAALAASRTRLLRESLGLPSVRYD